MKSQVIYLSNPTGPSHSVVCQRLLDLIARFERIETEELLAALPECPIARQNHLAALDLLLETETDIRVLLSEMSD